MSARRITPPPYPDAAEERRVERLQATARKRLSMLIKQTRIERGLTLRAAGAMCNISPSYLSLIERCENAATIDQIVRLAHFMNIDFRELFSDLE